MAEGNSRWSLLGMTALVIGGTKGIGGGVGTTRSHSTTCSRNQTQLNESLHEWTTKGYKVTGSVCDVISLADREKLIAAVSCEFNGKLDILVNNVGTDIRKQTLDFTGEDFNFLFNTNVESAYHICQLAHPLLKASEVGNIIFISSIAGVVSINVGSALYGATKGAINQLTKSLACEWAKDNIRTNCVAPGPIKTPLAEEAFKDEKLVKSKEFHFKNPSWTDWRGR